MMLHDRVILHCDCNSFFASVETALNPEYIGVPMAVCGSQEERHGIVLAKNELAKSFGVRTADTIYSAKKLCPNLVIAEPHYDEYVKFSSLVSDIYSDYTDIVEPFGIDESWLDVTASERLFGSGIEIAEEIRRRVKSEIGITVSIGVSFNKVFAKLGSDYKKPDAITCISRENYQQIVYPLPVSDLLFVGGRTVNTLASFGIRTIGELAAVPSGVLTEKFGKCGEMLSKYARGEDDAPVVPPNDEAKSIGNGYTFKRDLTSYDDIRSGVEFLSEEIARRLREKSLLCGTVSVSLKDEYLRVVQRQRALDRASDLCQEIATVAMSLVQDMWSQGRRVRSITVTAHNLIKRDTVAEQMDIFVSGTASCDQNRMRARRGEIAVDYIRQRFGSASIVRGSSIGADLGIYDPKTAKEAKEKR